LFFVVWYITTLGFGQDVLEISADPSSFDAEAAITGPIFQALGQIVGVGGLQAL